MNRFKWSIYNMKLILENWRKYINESAVGYYYEDVVISSIIEAGIVGNIIDGAGASAADADADMEIDGKIYKVEVKLDKNAQMGGTSFRYYPHGNDTGQKFDIVSDSVEKDTIELIEESLYEIIPDLDRFLEFVGAKHFPMITAKERWEKAVAAGLLRPLNVKISQTAEFIAHHYNKKGINYIQIGRAGLFYLGSNPANLPVPELEGDINLEVRAARSGSRKRKDGSVVVAGGLRVQGRLQFKGKSPYTLDDANSIEEMLNQRDNMQ